MAFFLLAMGLRIDMFGIFVRSIETILAYLLVLYYVVVVLCIAAKIRKKVQLRAQSRTSKHKAWFRYPASLVRKFWKM